MKRRSLLKFGSMSGALALAGHTADAIRALEPAARGPNTDPTIRQNLALAYAFAGNWDNARAVAAQELPVEALDSRHVGLHTLIASSPAGDGGGGARRERGGDCRRGHLAVR